jgi:hypothetical protein
MKKYRVKVIYEMSVEAKHEQEAEERAYERMEDMNPKVEVDEEED